MKVMKSCPACREDIHSDALKCRFCGEFLIECLECGQETASGLNRCHRCKKPLERSRRGLSSAQFKTVEERFGAGRARTGLGRYIRLVFFTIVGLVIIWAAILWFTKSDPLDDVTPLLEQIRPGQDEPETE